MGRASKEQAEKHREELIEAASQLFRERGVDGVSVPELTASTGLTHGAFYRHFGSKEELAQIACASAFEEQIAGLRNFKENSEDPERAFIDFYLSDPHRSDVAHGCPLASLSGEVARTEADSPVRASFVAGVRAFADGVEALGDDGSPGHRAESLARLSMLMGALSLSRATEGDPISDEIIDAVRAALEQG
ncbi:MAG TPA: TetR/AcrR family transcriptional regulator [Solirubrobacterales bacterium]